MAEAIAFQRDLHEREEEEARAAIVAAGCEIADLTAAEHAALAAAVQPIYGEARRQYGDALMVLAGVAETVA